MQWLFYDITETVSVAEAIWTAIGVLGSLVCLLLFVGRARTLWGIYTGGIDGSTRLLAWLRAFRAGALGLVFGLISLVGFAAMDLPTNPATVPTDPASAIPTISILLVEILLFVKAVVEEVIEAALANTRGVKDAAEAHQTPRLSG